MNVTFHWAGAPRQREPGPHCRFVALQVRRKAMERRFAGGVPPWYPRRCVAAPHHSVELLGHIGASRDVGTKRAEVLREGLLGVGWIGDDAEEERADLPRAGMFWERGERTLARMPPNAQADPEPTAKRNRGKVCSLGLQFSPQLVTIVAAFGPPLL